MKTVLHVLNTNAYSGAENVAITIIRTMKRLYSDYRLIYVSPNGPIKERLESCGVEFEPIEKVSIKEIRRIIKKYTPDMIHAHDFTASIVCGLSTSHVPVISHIHHNAPWIRRIGVKTVAYWLSSVRYKKVLGVSSSVFDEFVFGRFIKKKTEVIGNPIDLLQIRDAAMSAEINDGYDIAFIGRLSEAKNPIMFVDIASELSKRMSLRAVMIGDGEMKDMVEKRISELGLTDTVKLLGFLENPHGVLASSRILCVTSTWEGYGLVAAEALALGKPVVATPVGGLITIIKGTEGRLCQNTKDFVDAIESLLKNEDEYSESSKSALMRASEIDNLGEYAEKIHYVYSGE